MQIQEVGKAEYEWSLPDGLAQTLNIDLRKLGVDPKDYVELRFDLKPLGSQVALHTMLFGTPTEKELSSWYTKFQTGTGEWAAARFDLRVDDDGALYPQRFPCFQAGVLRMNLGRRMLGYPGEPQWRKAVFRNPRLIRWAVVPVSRPSWTPAAFQERVAAAAKVMPVDGWKRDTLRKADEALKYDFPAYDWWPTPGTRPRGTPHWGNSYRCPACKGDMRQATPNDIHHHLCLQCGKKFENDPFLDQCARQEYFAGRFAASRCRATPMSPSTARSATSRGRLTATSMARARHLDRHGPSERKEGGGPCALRREVTARCPCKG
ncbi:MAG: hypothetical protein FJ291_24410 [Planctomycetes bacterium]|nr:hypothetical protein [Planctomycetota bacterium]